MHIETKVVTQLEITKAKGKKFKFGTILVMYEDVAANAGKISITHDGETWNGYWGSMGSTLVPFFCGADPSYLGGNLRAPSSMEYDQKATLREAKRYLRERRREREISADEFKELNAKVEGRLIDPQHDGRLLSEIFGPDWPHCLQHKTTERYLQFIELVEVVQEALKRHSKPAEGRAKKAA